MADDAIGFLADWVFGTKTMALANWGLRRHEHCAYTDILADGKVFRLYHRGQDARMREKLCERLEWLSETATPIVIRLVHQDVVSGIDGRVLSVTANGRTVLEAA